MAEVHVPIDSTTKKSKAIAFVTFLIPEHAVKAFTDLDGKIFQACYRYQFVACQRSMQGRLLHIIPAADKKHDSAAEIEEASYAKACRRPVLLRLTAGQKQVLKRKAESEAPFNWNTLFLRSATVADAMSSAFGMDKGDLLSTAWSSLPVVSPHGRHRTPMPARPCAWRWARRTLWRRIRSFSARTASTSTSSTRGLAAARAQASPIRRRPRSAARRSFSSKTCLLRRAPTSCGAALARARVCNRRSFMFSKHGTVGRVVLPPSHTVALVEFFEPSEARTAFRALAYSKYKTEPLYLEVTASCNDTCADSVQWAPVGVFVAAVPVQAKDAPAPDAATVTG